MKKSLSFLSCHQALSTFKQLIKKIGTQILNNHLIPFVKKVEKDSLNGGKKNTEKKQNTYIFLNVFTQILGIDEKIQKSICGNGPGNV